MNETMACTSAGNIACGFLSVGAEGAADLGDALQCAEDRDAGCEVGGGGDDEPGQAAGSPQYGDAAVAEHHPVQAGDGAGEREHPAKAAEPAPPGEYRQPRQ